MFKSLINKKQSHVIGRVTFGNILEAFEVYSYAYLTPVLAKTFFNFESYLSNLISVFIVFGSGFIARPLGALLFGRFGDLVGRKKSFLWSITFLTIPTFLMGCLPTYSQIGIFAPILLGYLRLIQSLFAAGESPGSFCMLYENSNPSNARFMTSWGAYGNQIGAILGVIETFLMDEFMSPDLFLIWGWRISFWSGGLIGLTGMFLRHKLHETPVFQKLQKLHKIDKETISEIRRGNFRKIILGTGFGVINAATFYFIATYIPTYFDTMIGLSPNANVLVSLTILILTTIFLPFFGRLGDKFDNKTIFILCALSIIGLLYPFYYSVINKKIAQIAIFGFLFLIPITCMTALIPYLLTNLFPAPIRFTGVGLTFNLADGIIGGFTPSIALILIEYSNNQAAFCWFILACALISLVSFFWIKEHSYRQ